MIQPLRCLESRSSRGDLVDDVGQRPGEQHLVGAAEVGAPIDLPAAAGSAARQASSPSSITTMFSAPDSTACGQPAAGGDQHRLADAVQHDPVRRGELPARC